MKRKILLNMGLVLLFGAPSVYAQGAAGSLLGSDGPGSYDLMISLKAEIKPLLEENKKLVAAYYNMKVQFEGARKEYEEQKIKAQEIKREWVLNTQSQRNFDKIISKISREIDRLNNDVLIQEGKVAYLTKEIYETEERHRIRKLQLADMQYEENEMRLDLKLKDLQAQEAGQHHNMENEDLRRSIEENEIQEERLRRLIDDISQRQNRPNQSSALETQIDTLERRAAGIEQEHRYKTQEASYLREKRDFAQTDQLEELRDLRSLQGLLEREVDQLYQEYDIVNRQVDSSSTVKRKMNNLLSGVIQMDKENQQLRKQIFDVKTQLKSIR